MAQGTKRKRGNEDALSHQPPEPRIRHSPVERDLLQQCYRSVVTLRHHVLSQLPRTSRLRRRKIRHLGKTADCSQLEAKLAQLLDTTLVCSSQASYHKLDDTRWEQWLSFSQKGDESHVTISDDPSRSLFCQSAIVDFVIWLLFSRTEAGRWPKHILCDGFRRQKAENIGQSTSVPGIFGLYQNSNVVALKNTTWSKLLALLGQSGERIMIDLLIDYQVFVEVNAGYRNYYQLSGLPVTDFQSHLLREEKQSASSWERKLSDIILVKSRMMYAKPTITAKGSVLPGLKHIHVLNRCPLARGELVSHEDLGDTLTDLSAGDDASTIRVMMYIFPRQFGLHNVFTSCVDTALTAHKFRDYTLREEELAQAFGRAKKSGEICLPKVPKRLRGKALELVRGLQARHGRCSYYELLRHYCPSPLDHVRSRNRTVTTAPSTRLQSQKEEQAPSIFKPGHSQQRLQNLKMKSQSQFQIPASFEYSSIVDLATSTSQVSAFAQAVVSKVIPGFFWGEGEVQDHNKKTLLRQVDHFVSLKRFENMSLHEISQDMKIVNIAWLTPPKLREQKTSHSDSKKRRELFHEFLYYVFDSFLIPLIRSNFYVTESNTHRQRVFYFRHDVWKIVAEPSLAMLKETMLDEVSLDEAERILDSRRLGFSHIRLLPKRDKLRPITNLRRRPMGRNGSKVLGPSINSILGPVYTLCKFEKASNPAMLGSTMFSVSDIYDRLRVFKASLGPSQNKYFFAKVDVKAAFDTIPQAAVVKLMHSVPTQKQYRISKHAEVKPGELVSLKGRATVAKPIRRWQATALAEDDPGDFLTRLEKQLGGLKKDTVFIDTAARRPYDTGDLMRLLSEHVENHIVKIGKKFYRQKRGIPQGSVLSSFLCNYFYADLEAQHLSFLRSPDCLLLRLIDDFLLITLDKNKAISFCRAMHKGFPEYGVEVNPEKTLVNFEAEMDGNAMSTIRKGGRFPYCGTLIDCNTLEITKDRTQQAVTDISDSLTVEYGRVPGQTFQRKILNAFKIQSHLMFFDTNHNSVKTVLHTLREAFRETASKMWAYGRSLPNAKQPSSDLVIRTITSVIGVAYMLLISRSRRARYPNYTCSVRKSQVIAIGHQAFLDVLSQKQARYGEVIEWLRQEIRRLDHPVILLR